MTASWYKLELETWHLLEDNGYLCRRAPGSKGASDITALKAGEHYDVSGIAIEILFVQCKETGPIPPDERTRLLKLAREFGATTLWARWSKVGRAARTVEFRQLTGPGPRDWQPWTPNHAIGTEQ